MVDGALVNLLCEDCTDSVGIGERQESVRVRVRRRGDDKLVVKYWDETERLGSDEIVVRLPVGVQGHIERVSACCWVGLLWFFVIAGCCVSLSQD